MRLDEKGSPSYEIEMPVAWDFIENTEGGQSAVSEADALVFGSLVLTVCFRRLVLCNSLSRQ